VALCAESTPASHVRYLHAQQVPAIIAGAERVDLGRALEALYEQFGVKKVRVDSGGVLNGALLRAGLVDEVSVVINPELVGGESPMTIFVAPDLTTNEDVIGLKLLQVERTQGDYLWVRYQVRKQASPASDV
jgi:2,5-diamino-6-(ribosylamino)-4(3H)-pyrimidinone 5'-phosphate reductase